MELYLVRVFLFTDQIKYKVFYAMMLTVGRFWQWNCISNLIFSKQAFMSLYETTQQAIHDEKINSRVSCQQEWIANTEQFF